MYVLSNYDLSFLFKYVLHISAAQKHPPPITTLGYDNRSFVGSWGNMELLMESSLLHMSLESYVMWQSHIQVMKLSRYPLHFKTS